MFVKISQEVMASASQAEGEREDGRELATRQVLRSHSFRRVNPTSIFASDCLRKQAHPHRSLQE